MSQVTLHDNAIYVGDRRIPLFSGEVHFWRIFRENWRPVLQSVKDMGLAGIATYVQWGDAERRPGDYDFTGRTAPQRDMVGFLELCAEMDLWVLFRPGPYIYAETRNMGIADRAVPYHRLHPRFQEMAREYMAAVTEAAAPFQATKGGPIIVWQADNEIDPTIPHYETQLGLAGEPGIFQEWLAKRYGAVDALNEAWGTDYRSLEKARAWCSPMGENPKWRRRWLDLIAWKWDYIEEYAHWASDTYKSLGVEVPMLINMFPGVGEHHWRSMHSAGDFIGLDTYPANEFRAEPSEHRRFMEKVRTNAAISHLPYIAEFESGCWHGHHHYAGALTGRNYRLAALSALAAGAKGWNWYMIAERDNWQDSPINALGGKRHALFDAFKSVIDVVKQYGFDSLPEPATNLRVAFSTAHYVDGKPAENDPALNALYDADLNYRFFDLDGPQPDGSSGDVCFYSGHHWLPRAHGEALREWVLGAPGRHLVCFKNYPREDEFGNPYDPLGIGQPAGATWMGKVADLTLGDQKAKITGALWEWDVEDATPLVALQRPPALLGGEEEKLQLVAETGRAYTIGFQRKVGDGSVTVMGCDATPQLALAIVQWLGADIPCRSETAGVHTAVFGRPDGPPIIIAVNNGDEPKAAVIRLGDGRAVTVDLPAKDGRVIEAPQRPKPA
ncbi:MAG TPA: beta-galactosidase [Armatimonadota bacterium]|jgi:hypothetical protein